MRWGISPEQNPKRKGNLAKGTNSHAAPREEEKNVSCTYFHSGDVYYDLYLRPPGRSPAPRPPSRHVLPRGAPHRVVSPPTLSSRSLPPSSFPQL